jgi:hypothetical protein
MIETIITWKIIIMKAMSTREEKSFRRNSQINSKGK